MRRYLHILALIIITGLCVPAKGGNLTAYLYVASFNSSGGQSYVETYLNVSGQSALYLKDSNNKFQGKINVKVLFYQGDSVKTGNNYNLLSPEAMDTQKHGDFIDVQRYWLKKGKYVMELTVTDRNNPKAKTFTVKQKINVGYPMDSLYISDAEFLESYTPATQPTGILYKNGYNMVPYVYNYYPDALNELSFYAEVYNAKQALGANEKIILKYFIESSETHSRLFEFNNVSVKATDTINPLLGGFNIDKLASGNYLLVIQAIDKNNRVRATRSYPFIRHSKVKELNEKDLASIDISNSFVNKITNKDTLVEDIRTLWPISSLNERDFATDKNLPANDFTLLKQYFYNFWVTRNPSDPEGAWLKYNAKVKEVNREFKTFGVKGYQTDRGRVFLQYGTPDQRVRSSINPSSYPYEIWEYYRLADGEVDRKFVFYEPDQVTNNYELLHSNAIGEIHNRQWQAVLNSTFGMPSNVDINNNPDAFGENALDEFSNPR